MQVEGCLLTGETLGGPTLGTLRTERVRIVLPVWDPMGALAGSRAC